MDITNLDEILAFAIDSEQESHDFYMDLSGQARSDSVRETLVSMAQEELSHKEKLLAMRAGRVTLRVDRPVPDLKIGDYLVPQRPHADMDYAQALVLAMQKEKAAFKLYSELAGMVDGEPRALLLSLAQEEARHKLRFEIEYDDFVLREN